MPQKRAASARFCVLDRACICHALIVGSLALGACRHDKISGDPAADPSQTVAPGFSFVPHDLPGLSWNATIAYPTPPYPIGASNDGKGNLTLLDLTQAGLISINTPPRVPSDIRVADFNGDGIPDVISSVYSPTNVASWATLYFGSADGTFTQDMTFGMQYHGPYGTGFRGRTETIVVADFNNDGAVDIFLPTYTYLNSNFDLSGNPAYLGPYDGKQQAQYVYNARQSFLLLNDGTGHFVEQAVGAGVSMHAALSGISPPSTDPAGNQPEGAQAVDFNMDGLIDLYVGGHLFINQGVDDRGVPHFKDMAAAWGLTQDVLRAAPPWGGDALPPNYLVTDEGAKFLDWNNDGRLDLLLFRWDWGPTHGARLFEFTGTRFIERTQALTTQTATCKEPASGNVPFFASATQVEGNHTSGINVYDLDNDGFEDVLVTGIDLANVIFRNTGCRFVDVSAGALTSALGDSGAIGLADFDGDGSIDVISSASDPVAHYYENTAGPGHSFTVEVLGTNGERNQFGRVIQVFPPGTNQVFTRVVDGGSGYLTQNQYPILVGTPYSGAHTVKVYFAPLAKCVYGGPPCHAAILSFSVSPGQHAAAYAPSVAHPSGVALITPGN
jgi:hypothetical protein